eukprot:gene11738-24618_t
MLLIFGVRGITIYFLWFSYLIFVHGTGNISVIPSEYDPRCDHPSLLPLQISAHYGNYDNIFRILTRIKKKGHGKFLMMGGSITSTGIYYHLLEQFLKSGNITFVNRGHPGTDLLYARYCIFIWDVQPDIVFLEYKLNDKAGRPNPEDMEAMIRKLVRLPSSPLVVIVNFSLLEEDCSKRPLKYLQHAMYYGLPLLDLCPYIHHCFGRTPSTHHMYSHDGIHPTGPKGGLFLGALLIQWWKDLLALFVLRVTTPNITVSHIPYSPVVVVRENPQLPARLFPAPDDKDNRRHCECLNDDSPRSLAPVSNRGFLNVSRSRSRSNPESVPGIRTFANVKRCWESDVVGSRITFSFRGTNLMVALYQRSANMSRVLVYLDLDLNNNNDGNNNNGNGNWTRSMMTSRLRNKNSYKILLTICLHTSPATTGTDELGDNTSYPLTFEVSPVSSNPAEPGHNVQIIALLYSAPHSRQSHSNSISMHSQSHSGRIR